MKRNQTPAANRLKRRVENANRIRTQNAVNVGSSGAGQRQDLGASQRISRSSLHPLDRSASDYIRAREWAQLYYKEWTARKIVNIPVEDMLRNRWTYKGLNEQQSKTVDAKLRKLGFYRALKQALRMERLVGGAIILIGVRDEDDKPELPLDLSTVNEGDLIFTNVVPRTKVSSYEYNQNPLSPEFGKPDVYTVWDQKVHKSRMLIFDGDPLTDNEVNDLGFINRSYDGFGVSVLSSIWDDINRSVGARQGAMQLIQRAAVLIINNKSFKAMLESNEGTEKLRELDEIADQMSMYQAAMIESDEIDLTQWSANFGSVPELVERFLQVLAAASDIPATRFLGQAPGGLNSDGKSALTNYYDMIGSQQTDRLQPQLEKLLPVLLKSELPEVKPDAVEIEFPSLWEPDEVDQSTIRTQDTTNIVNASAAGLVSDTEARNELVERGVFKSKLEKDPILPPSEEDPEALDIVEQLGALEMLNDGNSNRSAIPTA